MHTIWGGKTRLNDPERVPFCWASKGGVFNKKVATSTENYAFSIIKFWNFTTVLAQHLSGVRLPCKALRVGAQVMDLHLAHASGSKPWSGVAHANADGT